MSIAFLRIGRTMEEAVPIARAFEQKHVVQLCTRSLGLQRAKMDNVGTPFCDDPFRDRPGADAGAPGLHG